jgi:hypothetical protein
MEIKWTNYFRIRCGQRGFSLEGAEHVIRYSTERYFDADSSRRAAVGYADNRLVLIPYEEEDHVVTPVTIHETDRRQISLRVRNGRFMRM